MNHAVLVLVQQRICSFTIRLVALIVSDVDDHNVVDLSQIISIQFLAAHIPYRYIKVVALGRVRYAADKLWLAVRQHKVLVLTDLVESDSAHSATMADELPAEVKCGDRIRKPSLN